MSGTVFPKTSGTLLLYLPSKTNSKIFSSPNILIKQHCPSPLSICTMCVCMFHIYSDIVSYVWTLVDVLKWTSELPHSVVVVTLMHLYQAFMVLCVSVCFLLLFFGVGFLFVSLLLLLFFGGGVQGMHWNVNALILILLLMSPFCIPKCTYF